MVCPEYDLLSEIEKRIYTGKLLHAVQNNSRFFQMGQELIKMATAKGVFEKVIFHPSEENNLNNENNEAATI